MRRHTLTAFLVALLLSWLAPRSAQPIAAADTPGWKPNAPLSRRDHAMGASDTVSFLFGGYAAVGTQRLLGDLWSWDSGAWRLLAQNGPAPRRRAALAYDTQRAELILFGGWDSQSELSDTWIWSNGAWSRRIPAQSPPARQAHTMAYDAQHGQVLLFGGSNGTPLSDTWAWDGTTWVQLQPAQSPPARQAHTMAYDAKHGQLLLFGGESGGTLLSDTWRWDGSAWAQLSSGPAPTARMASSAAYDAASQRILLFGGSGLISLLNDTWAWDGITWAHLSDLVAPSQRTQAAIADDASSGQVLLFGGSGGGNALDDTWRWAPESGWHQILPATSPPPRFGHAMAYDPLRNQVLLFGGYNGTSRNDTWTWDGTTWTLLSPPTSPPRRWGHTLTYDVGRGRIVLFGGAIDTGGFYSDTWEWDGTTWLKRTPTVSPPARRHHAATYDTARGRMVIFGGYHLVSGQAPTYYADTWEWDGTTWRQVAESGPAGRMGHSLIYAETEARTLLIGGTTANSIEDSIWAWDGVAWRTTQDSPVPTPRTFHAAVYQSATCRTIVVGGSEERARADTWQRIETPCFSAPTARIDSLAPNPANRSIDHVLLIGSGTVDPGSGRTISAYRWLLNGVSSIGQSPQVELRASDLAVGSYSISLAVRDSAGLWSTPVQRILTIIDDPHIFVEPGEITAVLISGEQTERSVTLSNTGSSPLSVDLGVEATTTRQVSTVAEASSTLTLPRLQRPTERLDPKLTEFAQQLAGAQETYLVYMGEIADLQSADQISDWRERGRFVVQRLQAVAAASQNEVLPFLESQRQAGAVSAYWPLYSLNAIIVRGDAETLRSLLGRPQVVGITISETYALPGNIAGSVESSTPRTASGTAWNISRIGADRVWEEIGTRGEGVVVGSIDTGANYNHPLLRLGYRGLQADGSYDHTYSWYDPTGTYPDAPGDNNGHGTHTIGTMVGAGGIGVAPGARWIAAKGCAARTCRDTDLLRAMEWMLAPYPAEAGPTSANSDMRPQVVSNSWGSMGGTPLFQQMVSVWRAAGMFPAFAAGNCGPEAISGCTIKGEASLSSPADYAESFATGATDKQDHLTGFSSRGPSRLTPATKPDLTAPGAEIESAWPNGATLLLSGTSMASPHTAGAAALLLAVHPGLAIEQVESLLRASAHDLGTSGPDPQFGYGLLDVYAAAQAAQSGLGWVRLSQKSALIQPGASTAPIIRFDGRGVLAGEYFTNLVIRSDDPAHAEIRLPLHLSVQAARRQHRVLISHVIATGMIIRWSAPDGRIARLEYAINEAGPWQARSGAAGSTPGETIIALRGLAPQTSYLLRLIAADGTIEDNNGTYYRVTTSSPLSFAANEPNGSFRVHLPLIVR
ncbi:MAG: kelch repeat-containing protein [Chloroflexales bacterium]